MKKKELTNSDFKEELETLLKKLNNAESSIDAHSCFLFWKRVVERYSLLENKLSQIGIDELKIERKIDREPSSAIKFMKDDVKDIYFELFNEVIR